MTSRPATAWGLAWLTVISWSCTASSVMSPVEHLDVELRVEPDGAVVVGETFTLTVPPRGARFSRHVGGERADALAFVASSIDGQVVAPDAPGSTSVEVSDGDDLDATWTFAPGPAAAERTISFTYRAAGAVAVRGTRGTLQHVAVPASRRYAVRAARIRAVVPEGMHVFEGTGIAEAGWTVARTADGILAERGGLDTGAGATVQMELGIDPAAIAEPTWQRHAEWASQMVPAFISGGLFILVIGTGILWIIRFQYPRRHASAADQNERHTVRTGLRTSGAASMGFAAILAAVMRLTLSHAGAWSMALPVSLFLVGLVFVAVSRRIV